MLKTRYLLVILFILLLLLIGLGYLYLVITRPPDRDIVRPAGLAPIRAIYGFGSRPDQFLNKPHGVAVDSRGNIYTTDAGNKRVVVFDRNGNYKFSFGRAGEGDQAKEGDFCAPLGIDVDKKTGRVYVADRGRSKVLIFDAKGRFIKEFSVMLPIRPLIADDRLFVTTFGPILIFDLEGKQLNKWGARGRQKGEFDFANGIAMGKDGDVYVSDTNNTRIVGLNKRGEVIWVEGRPPIGVLDLERKIGLPAGLALDDDENIYVVDAFHFSIKVYDKKGKQRVELGAGHSGDGEGEFYFPADIEYMGRSMFVIADKYNNRLQILRISLAQAEAAAGKRGLPAYLWEALKPWCPWLLLLLLILVSIVVGRYEARRRRSTKEAA